MLFKILDGDKSVRGGDYTWSLPAKNDDGTWTPGEWSQAVNGDLVACSNGYHLANETQLIDWLGPDIYEAEAEETIDAGKKIVCRRARLIRKIETWNEKTARLFAVWCARDALKLISNPDQRSIAACDVAEKFANGNATRDELDAAWDAVRDAAWAARAAAWDAARAAARDAAWDAARDAAWDAARDAAWDAARAAAWVAARDAAWDAARAAAWDAARDVQAKKLIEILHL